MRGDRPRLIFRDAALFEFTPHARGSTSSWRTFPKNTGVYPACAGIDLLSVACLRIRSCLPRMRGDRPLSYLTPSCLNPVYPACAGIDPLRSWPWAMMTSLPRMRGDRPQKEVWKCESSPFTPHARGSTPPFFGLPHQRQVYPACAGIDPVAAQPFVLFLRLPRMRGDRPWYYPSLVIFCMFTPHARGSTALVPDRLPPLKVYPACAGIDPNTRLFLPLFRSLPRMRGDRPMYSCSSGRKGLFTPHARGSTQYGDD